MGACIEGQKNTISINQNEIVRSQKRKASSIEDVMDPRLCRGGTTKKKSTLIRRQFLGTNS